MYRSDPAKPGTHSAQTIVIDPDLWLEPCEKRTVIAGDGLEPTIREYESRVITISLPCYFFSVLPGDAAHRCLMTYPATRADLMRKVGGSICTYQIRAEESGLEPEQPFG